MLSVNAMIKTLFIGSAGSFSLFTQSTVVLMEEEGLQEMIGKDKMRPSRAANNFGLFIFKLLSGSFLGIRRRRVCRFSSQNK
jgi:hypothetical protein